MHRLEQAPGSGHRGKAPEQVVAGIYGLGGIRAGDNPTLHAVVASMGGETFHAWQQRKLLRYLENGAAEGKQLVVYGYSRGGHAAIKVANALGRRGIPVALLATFDAYSFFDHSVLRLKYDNVAQAMNFMQRNARSAGRFGWWGSNPYWGSHVESPFIEVHEVNFTGLCNARGIIASHLNIVRRALDHSDLRNMPQIEQRC